MMKIIHKGKKLKEDAFANDLLKCQHLILLKQHATATGIVIALYSIIVIGIASMDQRYHY